MINASSNLFFLNVFNVFVPLVMINNPIHSLISNCVVFLVHFMDASDSRLIVVGYSFTIFNHFLMAFVESILVLAHSVALMMDH